MRLSYENLLAFILLLFLCGCSTLQTDVQTVLQDARQPATRVPLYVYRADLQVTVDKTTFDGVGVTSARSSEMDIDIVSQINLDRVEVETCAREDVCESGKPCNANFALDDGWFGTQGKHLVYHYTPSTDEAAGACPIYFRVYAKTDLASWGFLAFRTTTGATPETLPAHMVCNGVPWKFSGHSMCQTKQGLLQRIVFDQPVDDFDLDKTCGAKQLDSKTFQLRPQLGLCTGEFLSQGKWHGLDLIGYDTVLVGGS